MSSLINEFPLMLVEWVDSSRLANGWMDTPAIPEPYLHKCIAVGFFDSRKRAGKNTHPQYPGHRTAG
jgi:hypothetical protein